MKHNESLELHYSKINDLYSQYVEASHTENAEDFKITVKNKLFTEIWNTVIEIKKYKQDAIDGKFDAYTIFEVCNQALKYYELKSSNNNYFSKYVFSSIYKKIKFEKLNDSLNSKDRLLSAKDKKLKRQIIQLERLGQSDITKIAELLNISKDKVIELNSLNNVQYLSATIQSEDNEFSILDIKADIQNLSPSDNIIKTEELLSDLVDINNIWAKENEKNKPLLSDYITISILNLIESNKITFDIEDFSELEILLEQFNFINKIMINEYLYNKDYKILTFTELGKKYNLTKSGISKKWSRFLEKYK